MYKTVKPKGGSKLLQALGGPEGLNQLPENARLYAEAGVAMQLGNPRYADALVKRAINMHAKKRPMSEQPRQ